MNEVGVEEMESEAIELEEGAGADGGGPEGANGVDQGAEELEAPPARERLDGIVESLLFAAGTPLPLRRMVEVLDGPTAKEIRASIERLVREYDGTSRGIHLVAVAGGYQFRTAPANAEYVRALLRERPSRLGRATLETLAIVAYKQPVTRPEIEAIRGVDADSAIANLLAKRLIKIAGRKEAVGRPLMYATTPEFLEAFGIAELGELPALREIGPVPEPEDELESEADEEARATAAEPGTAAAEDRGTAAEDPEPGGSQLEADGGGDDPGGPGVGERPLDPGAGDEGGSEPGQDHG